MFVMLKTWSARTRPNGMLHENFGMSGSRRDILHVTHVVLSLDVGGLERGLLNQIREGLKLGERISVICLERPGTLAPRLVAMDVTLRCLDKRPGIQLSLIGRLKRMLGELKPDVVHSHQIGGLFYAGPSALRAGAP